jgi:hypothetical protein
MSEAIMSTAAKKLLDKYPAVITTKHLKEIFGGNIQVIRRLARAGKLPFRNISISGRVKKFYLAEVVAHLENGGGI